MAANFPICQMCGTPFSLENGHTCNSTASYAARDRLNEQVAQLERELVESRNMEADLNKKLETAESALRDARESKNGAYAERDKLVAALSRIFPAHLSRHPEEDTTWENDWRWIACIHIPVRELTVFGDAINHCDSRYTDSVKQVTWHIHDSKREMFNHLTVQPQHWDGHTTEEKYDRLRALLTVAAQAPVEK